MSLTEYGHWSPLVKSRFSCLEVNFTNQENGTKEPSSTCLFFSSKPVISLLSDILTSRTIIILAKILLSIWVAGVRRKDSFLQGAQRGYRTANLEARPDPCNLCMRQRKQGKSTDCPPAKLTLQTTHGRAGKERGVQPHITLGMKGLCCRSSNSASSLSFCPGKCHLLYYNNFRERFAF